MEGQLFSCDSSECVSEYGVPVSGKNRGAPPNFETNFEKGELQVQMQRILEKNALLVLCISKIQPESFHHLICGLTIEELSRDFIHPTRQPLNNSLT